MGKSKGPFMEFLRANAVQPAINEYVEAQIPTPTSKTENMAMLIHFIEFHPSSQVDEAPANLDSVDFQLTKTTQTDIRALNNPDVIAFHSVHTALNAVFNGLLYLGEQIQKFDPPILYPHANLFLGFKTTGMALTKSGIVRVGYTLEKVSREDFISALVE